jgi:hypothetical protein
MALDSAATMSIVLVVIANTSNFLKNNRVINDYYMLYVNWLIGRWH